MKRDWVKNAVAAVLGAVLTVVVGYVVFLLTDRSADLTAIVEYGEVHYPPALTASVNAARDQEADQREFARNLIPEPLDYSELLALLDQHEMDNVSALSAAEDIQEADQERRGPAHERLADFPVVELESPRIWPRGYWRAVVSNHGDTSAADVHIVLPGASAVSIVRDGTEIETSVSERIDLQTLAPSESVTILAWTRSPVYRATDVRLAFAEGRGDVLVLEDGTGIWDYIERNRPFVYVTLIWLLLAIGFLVVVALAVWAWGARHTLLAEAHDDAQRPDPQGETVSPTAEDKSEESPTAEDKSGSEEGLAAQTSDADHDHTLGTRTPRPQP